MNDFDNIVFTNVYKYAIPLRFLSEILIPRKQLEERQQSILLKHNYGQFFGTVYYQNIEISVMIATCNDFSIHKSKKKYQTIAGYIQLDDLVYALSNGQRPKNIKRWMQYVGNEYIKTIGLQQPAVITINWSTQCQYTYFHPSVVQSVILWACYGSTINSIKKCLSDTLYTSIFKFNQSEQRTQQYQLCNKAVVDKVMQYDIKIVPRINCSTCNVKFHRVYVYKHVGQCKQNQNQERPINIIRIRY